MCYTHSIVSPYNERFACAHAHTAFSPSLKFSTEWRTLEFTNSNSSSSRKTTNFAIVWRLDLFLFRLGYICFQWLIYGQYVLMYNGLNIQNRNQNRDARAHVREINKIKRTNSLCESICVHTRSINFGGNISYLNYDRHATHSQHISFRFVSFVVMLLFAFLYTDFRILSIIERIEMKSKKKNKQEKKNKPVPASVFSHEN